MDGEAQVRRKPSRCQGSLAHGLRGFHPLFLGWVLLFSLAALAALPPDAWCGESRLKAASFLPQWKPQAQFAGYYMAHEQGLYRKHGIDLTLLPGGPQNGALEGLMKGRATFATLWLSTAVQQRGRGVPLLNVAQVVQRSALMLVAKQTRGIRRVQDVNGKKVGLWGGDFQIQPLALLRKYALDVRIVPQSYSVNLFLRDGVDVASAMWYNEYHTILNAGLDADELFPIFFHEHGLNFPEDGIYVIEGTQRGDPDLTRAFVEASLEGWLYAFAHPAETLDVVLKHMTAAKIPADRVHQEWMLARMKDLILPRGERDAPLGVLSRADYDRVGSELRRAGLMERVPDFTAFQLGRFTHVPK